MNEIRELENKLRLLKEEERKARADKELQYAREQWKGKCMSTHLFYRNVFGKEIVLKRVVNVDRDPARGENSPITYFCDIIRYKHVPGEGRFNVEIESDRRFESPFPTWLASFRHEISEDVFLAVKESAAHHAETYFDVIRQQFKQNDHITMGLSHDQKEEVSWLTDFEFIELPRESNYSVREILSWQNHPFLYEGYKLLKTKESLDIVLRMADSLAKHATSWGGSIYTRDMPRAKILREFYQKHQIN